MGSLSENESGAGVGAPAPSPRPSTDGQQGHHGRHTVNEFSIDELKAGDAFRQSLIERADGSNIGGDPVWYGWAIMDAFLAGIDYARRESTVTTELYSIAQLVAMIAAAMAYVVVGSILTWGV